MVRAEFFQQVIHLLFFNESLVSTPMALVCRNRVSSDFRSSGAACSCAVAGAGTAFCGADATGAMAAGGVVATGAVVGAACGCARVLPGAFDTGAGPAGVEVVADAPDATGVAGVTGVTGLLGASGVAGSGGTSETAESPLTVTPGGALAKGQVNRVGKTIRRVAPSSTAAPDRGSCSRPPRR